MTSADIASGGNTVPPCENGNCFAVFVMPDTQHYLINNYNVPAEENNVPFENNAKIHLLRTMKWICTNRSSYFEESAGKTMNIEVRLHLGDLVQAGGYTVPGGCEDNHC